MTAAAKCPMCRKRAAPSSKYAPFCSARCRTQDLANWATGEYSIPAPKTEADEYWDVPPAPPEPSESTDG